MNDKAAGGRASGEQRGTGHNPGLWPVPGDGVLARHGGLILLSSLEDSQLVDVLLDLLEDHAAAGGDGRQFADAIADALEAAHSEGEGGGPSVLAFGATGSGLAVTVSGGAWADVTTAHGTARIEASHPGMLVRCLLRAPASGVVGGLSPADNGSASTDRFSRLDAGTVRAGGLGYYATGLPPSGGAAPGRAPAGRPSMSKAGAKARKEPEPEESAPAADADIAAAEPAAELADAVHADAGLADVQVAEPDLAKVNLAKADMAEADMAEAEAAEPLPAEAEAREPDGAGAADQWPGGQQAEPSRPAPAAEIVHEPTAAWIPPADAGPKGTGQWTPDWPGDWPGGAARAGAGVAGPVAEPAPEPPPPVSEVTMPPEDGQYHEPFESVLLADGGAGVNVPARSPLSLARDIPPGASSYVSAGPIIQGVYCKNGHFDDPEALFCAICGISMNQQTLVPRPGERPPLGVLLLDDGSVFQLDSDYVVGREPSLDASVAQGRARPLRVGDDSGIVSRVHARVQLEGWRVLVTDLGSANGTRIALPGQPGEQQLVPQVPLVLAAGSQVDLGGRMFRYESHRGR